MDRTLPVLPQRTLGRGHERGRDHAVPVDPGHARQGHGLDTEPSALRPAVSLSRCPRPRTPRSGRNPGQAICAAACRSVQGRSLARPATPPRLTVADDVVDVRRRAAPARMRPPTGQGSRFRPRGNHGKGRKDRVSVLPAALVVPLQRHLERRRLHHRKDCTDGSGHVELPDALDRKYPNATEEWAWQWVFPAARVYVHSPTGQRRRHHVHESLLQRSFRSAVRAAGLTKPQHVTPSVTLSQRTFSTSATTFARSRSSWATVTSQPR